jgi:dCTP deaminase
VICSDGTLRRLHDEGWKLVDPWPDVIQPSTIDVRLWAKLGRRGETPQEYETYEMAPGEFLLGATVETVYIPPFLRGQVTGKSSIGRLGLAVHITAGLLDAGFHGRIVLEMHNVSHLPITLRDGMPIAQVEWAWLDAQAEHPYGSSRLGSHYQGQSDVMPSVLEQPWTRRGAA